MANRWTPVDSPDKGDNQEWRLPSNEQQHVEQTVAPDDLSIRPEDITLQPTIAPARSGVQHGQNDWTPASENSPDSSWYVRGMIE